MASVMHTHLIDVVVEYNRDGCWAISSKNLAGLVLAGRDISALLRDVPDAIQLLYKLNFDMEVQVVLASEDGCLSHGASSSDTSFIPLPRTFVALHAA